MPSTNNQLAVPQPLTSESDPCSFSYQRYYKRADGVARSPSASSKRSRTGGRQIKRSKFRKFFSSVAKAFRPQARPAFVMLHGYKPPVAQKLSVRSRRSTPTTEMAEKRKSAPAVLITHPTIKRAAAPYRVHAHDSRFASSPALVEGSSVRFSHPTVQGIIKSPSPTTPTSHQSEQLSESNRQSGQSSATSQGQHDSIGNLPPTQSPICPETIWRHSDQFKRANGSTLSFDEFKDRFDGLKVPSDFEYPPIQSGRPEDRPPSLQFLTLTAPLDLDAPRHAPKLAEIQRAEVTKNRDEALHLLETGGVLAVVPTTDLPESAVPVASKQHPAALTPNLYPPNLMPGRLSTDSLQSRPKSIPTLPPQVSEFLAYDPQYFEQFNTKVKYGYDPSPPTSVKKGKKAADAHVQKSLDRARAKTPDSFATLAQHQRHYDRVESGVFDAPLMLIERPSNPSPPSLNSGSIPRGARNKGRTAYPPATPPSTPEPPRSQQARLTKEKLMHHKSASTTNVSRIPATDVPPVPAVPLHHKMNDNGFPVTDLRAARSSYSAEPKYQRRSINDVEAKYRKEHPAKKVKEPVQDKKVAKLEKEKAKLERKIAKEQEKLAKKEKKRAGAIKRDPGLVEKQKQIDDGVRRILNI